MKQIIRIFLAALLGGFLLPAAFAQGNQNNFPSKSIVYIGTLSSIPATCTIGQLSFITDATAGQNIYECGSTNVWTQQLAGSGSGSPGGAGTALQYRVDASTFGGVVNSLVDNSVDASGSNRTMLVLGQTWTAGASGNSEHVLDVNCTSQGSTAVNTLACGYFTLMNKNTAGANGHPLGLAIRFSDNSTGSATIGLSMDGLYVEANNAAGTTGVGTIPEINDINLANATLSSTSQIISVFNGVKYTAPIMGANTVITKEIAASLGAIRATTAQVVTSHLLNAGNCTDTGVYLAGVFCGARVDFQSPIKISGMTMGAASVLPATVTQPYILSFNNFHDVGTDATIDMLTTSDNGASGTMLGIRNLCDVGGSSGTITLVACFQGQIKGSGAATSTRSIVYDILASNASGGTTTTAIGFHANAITGSGIGTAYAVWTEGSSDFNRFDGRVGIRKIPTTTSPLAIAGLPTSSAGLVTGDVWANGNVLTIIP